MNEKSKSHWEELEEGIRFNIADDPSVYPPILDWSGVKDENGNIVPYSKEKALELIKKYPYIAMYFEAAADGWIYR